MSIMRGFSLVEVMVAMVIASIGVLAVSQSTISALSNNTLARERIAATNLAVDVIESWQASNTDVLPALECTNGTVILTTSGNSGCTMISQEVKTEFTITVSTQSVQAPMQPASSGTPVTGDVYAGLRITALLIDKNSTNFTTQMHMYAGTAGYGLFESNDSGSSWSRIDATGYATINALAQFNSGSSVVVAGTDSYAMANTGWGGSWQTLMGSGGSALPNSANILSVATDPYTLLLAGLDIYTNVNYGGAFSSSDTGASWSASLGDSGDPYTVYALVADNYAYAGSNLGIRYSTDSGATWASQSNTPTTTQSDIFALDYQNSTLFAGTDNGVQSSADEGATWGYEGASGKKITALTVSSDGANVTAGTEVDGLYSKLCGSTSSAHTNGMTTKSQLHIYSVAVPPVSSPAAIYVGTDTGLLKSTISSSSCGSWARADSGIGLIPQEKIVTVTWQHKGSQYSVAVTHISEKPY